MGLPSSAKLMEIDSRRLNGQVLASKWGVMSFLLLKTFPEPGVNGGAFFKRQVEEEIVSRLG